MRILVVPGLGDIHWVMLKLRSFARRHGSDRPKVTIWNFDGRPRSLNFVRCIPFVEAEGYWTQPLNGLKNEFRKCYMTGKLDTIPGLRGFDHFVCINGSLRAGKSMSDILPDDPIDWNYPVEIRQEDSLFAAQTAGVLDKYILLYFSADGMFRYWVQRWNLQTINRFAKELRRLLPDHRLVLTGLHWDKSFTDRLSILDGFDLVGRTSIGQLLALIKGASAFAGWCGGNTIISTHLGTPTAMIWCDGYFKNRAFQTNWVAPDRLGRTYVPFSVETASPDEVAACVAEMAR